MTAHWALDRKMKTCGKSSQSDLHTRTYPHILVQTQLGMRYGVASHTVESTLPIHTPTPAPPILLHSPTGRNAVPAAPAIKISSAHHSTTTEEDQDDGQDDEYQLKHQHHLRTQPPSPPAVPPSSPVNFGPSSPRINGVTFSENGGGVKFQTRPRGMTGDSTNSQIYPTYATYRQQQHANFDAFAQRIRKALETANAQHRQEQEELLEKQRREAEEQIRLQNLNETDDGSGSDGDRQPLPAISATHTRQILEADRSSISSAGAGPSQTLSVSTIKGRPRSSSAASMISNLSEKIRLGSGFFGRSSGVGGAAGGRSRAGSDASVLTAPPPPPQNQPQQHNYQGTSSTAALSDSVTSSSSGPHEKPSTTTMAALASATAVASAIFMPRESVYSQAEEGTGSGKTRSRRQSRTMTHPLAETANIDDEKQGSSEEEEEKDGHAEKSCVVDFLDVKYTGPKEIVISDHERTLSDDIHVLESEPTISVVSATRPLSQVVSVTVDVKPDGVS